VAIIGQGYVGLPLAIEFARSGFRVTGLDADPERIALLTRETHPSPISSTKTF